MELPADNTQKDVRVEYPYSDGLNMVMAPGVSRKEEPRWCLNVRSPKVGSLETRDGRTEVVSSAFGKAGLAYFPALSGLTATGRTYDGLLTFTPGATPTVQASYLDGSSVRQLGTFYTFASASTKAFDTVCVDDWIFCVNGELPNLAVKADGSLAYCFDSSQSFDGLNSMYGSPTAGCVNYYKGNLYLGDITISYGKQKITCTVTDTSYVVTTADTSTIRKGMYLREVTPFTYPFDYDARVVSVDSPTQFTVDQPANLSGGVFLFFSVSAVDPVRLPNGILRSSNSIGLLSLVNSDYSAGDTVLEVSDTTYFRPGETVEVWRGNQLVTELTVSLVNSTSVTVAPASVPISSSDQVWAKGTKTGSMAWRWPDFTYGYSNAAGLTYVGSDRSGSVTVMENVGNSQMIFTQSSLTVHNGVSFLTLDYSVGCPSRQGWVKGPQGLYFCSYKGIYRTSGSEPEYISLPVKPIFDRLSKAQVESCVASVKGDSVFFHFIGDVTRLDDDGTPLTPVNGLAIEYDIRQQNFYVHSGMGAYAAVNAPMDGVIDRLIARCDYPSERIYFLLEGDDDSSKPIPFEVERAPLYPNPAKERFSNLWKACLDLLRGDSADLFVSVDDKPFQPTQSQFRKGVSWIETNTPDTDSPSMFKGKKFRLAIRGMARKKYQFGWMAFDFIQTSEVDQAGTEVMGGYDKQPQ